MENLESLKIRELWTKFWESKQHKILPSASLIPDSKDKTVLFTTAGMQQLVPYLVGKPHELGKRVFNIQKCVRTVDIDEVGDKSHLTCFEMLGNWSLGDYFKKESIQWSFEFLTQYLKIPLEKIAVTVFEGDNDAPKDEYSSEIWKNVGIPEHKISYLTKKDNWWGPAGNSGPCGPDTEIFYRVGPEKIPPLSSNVKDEDDNWMEIWNNVFMEFYKDENGVFTQLSQQNVDTGMGFERINMVMQGVNTIYETDLFKGLINIIENNFDIKYPGFGKGDFEFNDQEKIVAKRIRIVCDHIRSACFMIGDGVIPSNETRGYVLRRLIRRMYYNLLLLSDKSISLETFIPNMINWINEKYGNYRKEINNNLDVITKTIQDELTQFQNTINKGLKLLDEKLVGDDKILKGNDIFVLYDTYGFPYELTKEIAHNEGYQIDEEGFYKELEIAKEKSRQGTKDMFKRSIDWSIYLEGVPQTQFVGYENIELNGVNLLKEIDIDGQKVLIFDKTPFYAESGGQTGDKGNIILDNGQKLKIKDVQKYAGVFLHFLE